MKFLVMADLEMLVLDKQSFNSYATDFYERVLNITGTCETWVIDYGNAKWLFSDELLDLLWSVYPWNAKINELTDLLIIFSTWLGRLKKEIVTSQDLDTLQLEPNIHAAYATKDYPDLDKEWRNVLARNVDFNPNQTVIFSFGEKPTQVVLQDSQSDYLQTFALIKNEADWQEILKKHDPWLKNNLPQFGDCPYQPPQNYGHKFPTKLHGSNKVFIDHKDRLWLWDTQENHWDVQIPPYGRDNYFRVWPDGRLVDKDK